MPNRTIQEGKIKNRIPLALLIALPGFILFSALAGITSDRFPPPAAPRPHYAPGEVLVKYKPVAATAIASSLSRSGATIQKSYKGVNVHHLKLSATTSVAEALQTFANDPAVEYAEPNYLRYAAATIPTDPFFPELWGLLNTGQIVNGTSGTAGSDIHAPEAWDITTGNHTVVVAVIDSGMDYNHPDLAGNVSPGLRYDFVHDDADPMDANGHGTHVAGTIAAVGNNGAGVAGVTWAAMIMPLRAGNAVGELSVADIVSAIDYAVQNGAKIINASYGGSNSSISEFAAIDNARQAGVLVVAAAGNESSNIDLIPVYPASYGLDNIIAVAATDPHDNLASFSNFGAGSVHVAAPGINIYSTRPARQTLWNDDFDDGNMADWTTEGTNDTWGLSSSTSSSGAFSLTVNPAGNYLNNSNSRVLAPPLGLAAAAGSKLSFVFTGRSQLDRDFLFVETSTDGFTWTNRTVYIINSSGSFIGAFANGISGNGEGQWYHGIVDLGNHDGQSSVHVRFHFTSNGAVTDVGWFIDDIAVTAAATNYSGSGSDYRYMSGTSMATPHVAGLAALIWGFKPDLTYLQIKDIILNSVDARGSLAGKTLSGGRINALNALFHVTPQAPGPLAAAPSSASAIDLAWSETSLNESGFRIERRKGTGAYAFISTTDKDTTAYSDTGLNAGTYCYRIASFNHGGNSPYSNEACAMTSGAFGGGGPVVSGGEPVVSGGDGTASDGGGGCFIATAAFGSPLAGPVQVYRKFRDRFLKVLSLDVVQGPDKSDRRDFP